MSRVLLSVVLLGLLASSFAAVLFTRDTTVPGWRRLARADPRKVVPIRIALKQRNVDVLEARVLDAANPESANYGKWLSPSEVLDIVAPEDKIVSSIAKWLMTSGAAQVDATGRDFIKAKASVRVVENIFNTQMYNWQHVESGKVQTRHVGAVHIPDEFAEHVEFVAGLSELWGPSHIGPKSQRAVPIAERKRNDVSAGYIIPENLRQFYSLPKSFWVNSKSSLAVAEFQDDASFNPQDSTYFNSQMGEKIKVDKIVGPYAPDSPDGESTLDVQYAFALGLNATTYFWTVQGWMYEFATDLFNAKSKPLVVSMSWGWPEPRQCEVGQCTNSKDYVTRVNTEFMKITGTGITLTAASGDQGAPGDTNPYCESSSTPISTIFPGASPWVLSVGATMTVKSGEQAEQFSAPACQQFPCATSAAETSCTYPTSLITSGGGFSNYVTRPSWQDAAVKAYLSSGVKLPSAQYYSAGNRAFPDVSANGHSYLIAINQQLEQVDGTSASSPVWAAVISLLNDVRLDAGKAPLGFVNPLLYTVYAKQPTAFHDITTGNNLCTESCCSQVGYYATKGWDAVTGLGSPNGQALIDYVKTLA